MYTGLSFCSFLLFYYYFFSFHVFHVINWRAGRGVFLMRLFVEGYDILLDGAVQKKED